MAFENTILAVCEDAGIDGAYFAYGTLFVPVDQYLPNLYSHLERVFEQYSVQIHSAGAEIAVDFVA